MHLMTRTPVLGAVWNRPLSLFDDSFNHLFDRVRHPEASRGWLPPVDILENEDALVFTTELPGFRKEDISIAFENGTLTVAGERRQEQQDEQFHRLERSYGRFERSFSLPSAVQSDQITAALKDGLLTLTLPKREESKPKKIEVSVR